MARRPEQEARVGQLREQAAQAAAQYWRLRYECEVQRRTETVDSVARSIRARALLAQSRRRGDITKFLTGPFQSLCEECHRWAKRHVQLRGYRPDIGADGWPTDANHPVYGRER